MTLQISVENNFCLTNMSATILCFLCSREYRRELLFPVLQSVARIYGQADMYEGLINDTDTLMIPKGASEIEIRMRQVL